MTTASLPGNYLQRVFASGISGSQLKRPVTPRKPAKARIPVPKTTRYGCSISGTYCHCWDCPAEYHTATNCRVKQIEAQETE